MVLQLISYLSIIFHQFSNRVTFRGLVATLGLMVFQQLSGINAVIFYSVSIFKLAGSDLDPAVSSIIIAAVQVVMSLAAIGLVEKFGRKTLLMISSTVMGICLAALGYYFRYGKEIMHVIMIQFLLFTKTVVTKEIRIHTNFSHI